MLNGTLLGQKSLSGSIGREVIQTGGGGGTSDYTELENLPSINDVQLIGNKTSEELGLADNEALDTKVDKTANPLKIYGTDANGNPVEFDYRYSNNTPNTVAGRDLNGNIQVKKARYASDAVNKEYVEDNFVPLNTTTAGNRVYASQSASDGTITQTTVAYATGEQKNTIALRDGSGRIYGVCTANSGNSTLTTKQYVDNLFNGANKAVSFVNYSSMITSLNALANTSYSVGQNIMIVTLQVPDLWVSEIAEESVAYTYVSDDDFVNELTTNGSVQVGYYKLSALETQKVDLAEYATLTELDNKLDKQTPEFDSGATRGYVYFIDPNNNQIVKKVQIQANSDTIPLRNPSGNFYVGDPTLPYECANVKTITALQGTEAPTESTTAKFVGQIYLDTTNNTTYQCTAIDTTNKVYTWVQLLRAKNKTLNNGVHCVYGINGNTGEQLLLEVDSTGTKYYHLVRQKEAGRVLVGDATEDKDAVNLQTLRKTYATDSVAGVARWVNGFGLKVDEYGRGQILQATNDEIASKTQAYKPITPNNLDYAIVQGLTNNSITLTDEQKTAIKTWLGL